MIRIILIMLACFLFSNLNSQAKFEKGYYLDNSFDTLKVLIKNEDWLYSPRQVLIKESEEGIERVVSLNEFQEISVSNKFKYVKKIVDVDRSSDEIDKPSVNRNAEFQKEELLLKVLIEGEATLFFYSENNFRRFFFQMEGNKTEQLVFKFFLDEKNRILKNNYFRQQLLNNFSCPDIKNKEFKSLKYNSGSLRSFFKRYNFCKNSLVDDFSPNSGKRNFSIYGSLGLRNSSLSISNNGSSLQDNKFDSKLEYSIGVYGEYVFPFDYGKWSFFIEPTFHHYEKDEILEYRVLRNDTISVNYKSIELPFGLKYNFVNKENLKFFVNPILQLDFALNSEINFANGSLLRIGGTPNLGIGIGTKIMKLAQVELQYFTSRNVLNEYLMRNSEYNVITVKFRIRVF